MNTIINMSNNIKIKHQKVFPSNLLYLNGTGSFLFSGLSSCYVQYRSILKVLSNIYEETFYKISYRPPVLNYFYKKYLFYKKIVIWNFSGPHFSAFGLNTKRYFVPEKLQIRDTFHAVRCLIMP